MNNAFAPIKMTGKQIPSQNTINISEAARTNLQWDQMVKLCFDIWPLAKKKISPIMKQICQVGLLFYQIRNKPPKSCQRFVKFQLGFCFPIILIGMNALFIEQMNKCSMQISAAANYLHFAKSGHTGQPFQATSLLGLKCGRINARVETGDI